MDFSGLLNNAGLLALIGTIFGGVGLKLIDHFLSKRKYQDDVATSLRTELRGDLNTLRAELEETEQQRDLWRERFYIIKDEYFQFRVSTSELIAWSKLEEIRKSIEKELP